MKWLEPYQAQGNMLLYRYRKLKELNQKQHNKVVISFLLNRSTNKHTSFKFTIQTLT